MQNEPLKKYSKKNFVTTDIFTLCLDPSGYSPVWTVLLGGEHGGVQLELLRPVGHAPAAGLGILPARAQWDELCSIMVQGETSTLLRNTSI